MTRDDTTRDRSVTVTIATSPNNATNLIALATTVCDLHRFHHHDLPYALWCLLLHIEAILTLAENKNQRYNPWAAQEWELREDDWRSVQSYCRSIAAHIDTIFAAYEKGD